MKINRPSIVWFLEEQYDTIVPNGRQAKIRCPFHADTHPSASVYRDSERMKCYSGCFDGRAVDVLDIVQETERLSFQEAVELTKSWPGTLVEAGNVKSTKAQRKKRQERKPYSFKILET